MRKIKKEYALVLPGGGTKGAYQVGIWKALNDLGIKINAIAGASIGAINGALFFQDDIDMIVNVYKNIKISDIIEFNQKIDSDKDLFDIANIRNLFKELIEKKGLENTPIKRTIEKYVDIDKIYDSPIDFGIISYDLATKKSVELFKEDIKKEEMVDYILASSCFPIFKSQKIGDKKLLDGGIYDNTPINMLIDKGYKNIIVANIDGIGFNKKVKDKDISLKVLSPTEDLGGIFNFNHKNIAKNILLGYLDTMKSFGEMQGNYYFFSQAEFIKMIKEFSLKNIAGLEMAAKLYKMDRYKVYAYQEFLDELYSRYTKSKEKYEEIKRDLKARKVKESIEDIKEGDFIICKAIDLYLDRPTAKKLKILEPYVNAVEALLELEDYMK